MLFYGIDDLMYLVFKGFTLENPDEGSALDPQAFEKA